jgi:hypothetical protein
MLARIELGMATLAALGACAPGVLRDPEGTRDDRSVDASPGVDGTAGTADADRVEPTTGPDAGTAVACDGGDDRVVHPANGHCYMRFSTPTTWQAALASCAQLGLRVQLATLTDADEHALLAALAGDADTWLGGTDVAVEGTWLWITGEPFGYQHWGVGEPNDGAGGEDCMILRKRGSQTDPRFNVDTWDDRPCAHTYAFICERE